MKRCLKFIGIFIIANIFINNVSASSVTIGQIKEELKKTIEEDGLELRVIDTSDEYLVFQGADLNKKLYSVQYNFKNDIINLEIKNTENMEDGEKATTFWIEDIATMYTLNIIYKLFDVDISGVSDDEYSNYGIILDTEEFSYDTGAANFHESGSIPRITNFSIDLNKFEEATKDLVGTYNKDNDISGDVFSNSSVSLSLATAYSNKLDLVVNVSGVSDKNTNKCNIWLVDNNENESLVATIDNCVDGSNSVTISDLQPSTEYSYKVELIETNSLDLSNTVYSEIVNFSTTAADNSTTSIDNPKTGSSYIYLVFGALFISIFTFIILFTCSDKKVKNM